MKRFLTLCLCAMLLLGLSPAARAAEDGEARAAMVEAAVSGDAERGRACAAEGVDWDELYLLAKALYAVTGTRSFTEEWRLCVGEVILNRVASPEFPDTLEEVIRADARYVGRAPGYFDALRPDTVCAEIAFRLLSGERAMDEASVVWQDAHYYDGGVFKSLYDYRVGGVHFCRSAHPELYE